MRYYYTTLVDSPVGQKLSEFAGKCMDVSHQAEEFAKKYGAESYIESPMGYAGGVAMLCFDTAPDAELWRKVELADGIAYEANVTEEQQEEIAKRIKDGQTDSSTMVSAMRLEMERQLLPIISEFALLDILTPKPVLDEKGKRKPVALQMTPTFFEYREEWYICLSYQTDTEDVTPILAKVYDDRKRAMTRLSRKKKHTRK